MSAFVLNIDKPQGAPGGPTAQLIFIGDGGSPEKFTITVNPSQAPTYPSASSAIVAGNVVQAAAIGVSPGAPVNSIQFNSAGSFGGVAGVSSDGTNLTAGSGNLRATRPQITTSIDDVNGNKIIGLIPTAAAVDFLNVTNGAAGAPGVVILQAQGSDAAVSLNLLSTGTGQIVVKPGTDSATAFQIQSAGGTAILDVNTSAQRVGILTASPGFTLDVNGTLNVVGASTHTGASTITISDAGTNNVTRNLVLIHNSSGAIAAGFGAGIPIQLQDSTTPGQDAGQLYASWMTATHATRSSQVAVQAVDQGTALADVAQFSFQHNGGAPVAQIVAVGTNAQANVPQFCSAADLTTGVRFAASNVFFQFSGTDKIQMTGSRIFVDGVALDFVNADVTLTRPGAATLLITATNVQASGQVTKYKNVNTAGYGVPAIYGYGRSTAQAAAVASVATFTVGAADGSFDVSANVLVTAFTAGTFTVTVAYTDESNTARTLTLNFSSVAGVLATAIAAAGAFEGVPLHIRCKAATTITIATTGTFTTLTYNVEGLIKETA